MSGKGLTVVHSRRDRPRTDVIRVLARPAYEDRVAIRIAQQHGDQRPRPPGILHRAGPELQRDDAGKSPEALQHRDEGPLFEDVAEARDGEEADDVEHVVRDR